MCQSLSEENLDAMVNHFKHLLCTLYKLYKILTKDFVRDYLSILAAYDLNSATAEAAKAGGREAANFDSKHTGVLQLRRQATLHSSGDAPLTARRRRPLRRLQRLEAGRLQTL